MKLFAVARAGNRLRRLADELSVSCAAADAQQR